MKALTVKIDLLGEENDPRFPQWRELVYAAMSEWGLLPCWNEFYFDHQHLPRHLRKQKIASIYINEQRVWKATDAGELIGKDKLKKVIQRIGRNSKRWRFRRFLRANLSFLLALGIAFFPKCPLCWAAYLSSLGLYKFSSITYKPWMLPVFICFLFLNILSLYLTRKRHSFGPLLLSLAGSLVIVLNRLKYHDNSLIYWGSGLMLMGALWNSLPRAMFISLKLYLSRIWKGLTGLLFGGKRET